MLTILLIVGCLTPETFSTRYAERLCVEAAECTGNDIDHEECIEGYDRGLTPELCPEWDAAAAARCLREGSWCDGDTGGSYTVPEDCGGLALGCG
jgi:hypothetical protein